jgi:hypothetical protein
MKRLLCLFVFGLIVSSGFWLLAPNDSHHAEYKELNSETDSKSNVSGINPYSAKQKRNLVQKELWFVKNNLPHKMTLQSADSELVLDHQNEGTEVLEKMQDVDCYVQEELFFEELMPFQIIRHIQAETATYYYQQEKLLGNNVKIWRYTIPGHELTQSQDQKSLMMSGTANSIEFAWVENNFRFSAKQFKAALHNDESAK